MSNLFAPKKKNSISNVNLFVDDSVKTSNERLSTGAKKDFFILIFCSGLIETYFQNDEIIKKDEFLTKRSNKHYKKNKKIDKELRLILNKLKATEVEVYRNYNTKDVGKFVKQRLFNTYSKIMQHIDKNTNFEFLAIQIIFNNFVDFRYKPLAKEFRWIAEQEEEHYKIFDLMIETNLKEIIVQINNEANKIILEFKK